MLRLFLKSKFCLLKKDWGGNLKHNNRYLITLDDGYKNQINVAAKILNKHCIKGHFFVSFKSFESGKALTIDNLLKWISYAPANTYDLLYATVNLTDENRQQTYAHLYEYLMTHPDDWQSLEKHLNSAFPFTDLKINQALDYLRFTPFDSDDIKTLKTQGHTVSAHGWDHKPLAIFSRAAQALDFRRASECAKKYCNSTLYSYPYGNTREVSVTTAELCKQYGFSRAYLNMPRQPSWPGIDANYLLRAFSVAQKQ